MVRRTVRCVGVWLTSTAAAALLALWLLPVVGATPVLLRSPAPAFDDLLVTLFAALALAAGGWLWVVVSAVSLEAVRAGAPQRGPTAPGRLAPAALRRLVLAACGVALVGGVAAPAVAGPPHAPPDGTGEVPVLAGLPLPDRPVDVPRRAPALTGPAEVVVRPGDTLWGLAAATLPPDAGVARVAGRCAELHRANRAVIGPDPDLILPGQRLLLPWPAHRPRR